MYNHARLYTERTVFAEVSENLARHRSENNFVENNFVQNNYVELCLSIDDNVTEGFNILAASFPYSGHPRDILRVVLIERPT